MTRLALLLSVAVAVVILALPLVLGTFGVTLLNYIGIATLVALGLVLLTGAGGMTSFGQAAFVGMGAYATAYLTTAQGLSPWLGLLVGLVLAALVALIIGAVTLHLGGHYLPITTIAWGIALYLLFGNFEALGRYGGLGNIPPVTVAGYPLDTMQRVYFLIWSCVGLAMAGAVNLLRSREGRAIRALRGGGVLVESLGISSFRIKLVLFVISALLATLAGWLYAHMQRFISPASFDLKTGIEYLLMATLGGAGSVLGALVGAAVVTLAKNWLQDLLPLFTTQSGNLEIIAFGVIFILLLQFAPQGIVPAIRARLPRRPRAIAASRPGDIAPLPTRPLIARAGSLLRVEHLTKRFGGLVAVNDVGFDVPAGSITALIGPNGAGKSTTFNLITGVLPPTEGRVGFAGRDVTGKAQRALTVLGIARTFQHVKLRPRMSLVENVMLGAYARTGTGFVAGALGLGAADEDRVRELAVRLLKEVGLDVDPGELAGNLALGQQRLLEIARALAADPVLILLDEPAAGLRTAEKRALANLLRALRARGMTVLLVEHDMDFLMSLADSVVVLNFGRLLATGTPSDVRANADVQAAYLGSEA